MPSRGDPYVRRLIRERAPGSRRSLAPESPGDRSDGFIRKASGREVRRGNRRPREPASRFPFCLPFYFSFYFYFYFPFFTNCFSRFFRICFPEKSRTFPDRVYAAYANAEKSRRDIPRLSQGFSRKPSRGSGDGHRGKLSPREGLIGTRFISAGPGAIYIYFISLSCKQKRKRKQMVYITD